MALSITIEATSGVTTTEVPEDIAKDLADVYETLRNGTSNRQAVVDFPDAAAARLFVRQGKAWASGENLVFARKGNVKENPTRVAFRIYAPGSGRGRKPGKK